MTEESRSQAEEIKDQFIDIIWEKKSNMRKT